LPEKQLFKPFEYANVVPEEWEKRGRKTSFLENEREREKEERERERSERERERGRE